MFTHFVPITKVQREAKKVFSAGPSFQIVLSNNEMMGVVISKEMTKPLLESGLLEELAENLQDYIDHDEETLQMIREAREGKGNPISFDDFNKKHGFTSRGS